MQLNKYRILKQPLSNYLQTKNGNLQKRITPERATMEPEINDKHV